MGLPRGIVFLARDIRNDRHSKFVVKSIIAKNPGIPGGSIEKNRDLPVPP